MLILNATVLSPCNNRSTAAHAVQMFCLKIAQIRPCNISYIELKLVKTNYSELQ